MSNLNQMYVSFLIEQKLRNSDLPASDIVTDFARRRHLPTSGPSLIHKALRITQRPRRRQAIRVPAIAQAKRSEGVA